MTTVEPEVVKAPRRVRGIPFIGSTFAMVKDPAKFFVTCYREYGPVFRVTAMGDTRTVLVGAEAANFMGTRAGRDCLRSKEFWQGLVDEWGAKRTLTGEDGETHQKLRAVMRHGYSRESLAGRHDELVAITDTVLDRDWGVGAFVPVVQAMQYVSSMTSWKRTSATPSSSRRAISS